MSDKPTAEQLAEWATWCAGRPPAIRAVAETLPPWICLRDRATGRGHYVVTAYEEPEGDGPVTVKVAHGADSHSPGFEVFGVSPDSLKACNCGNWHWPSQEQADVTIDRAEAFKEAVKDAGLKILPGLKMVPADESSPS